MSRLGDKREAKVIPLPLGAIELCASRARLIDLSANHHKMQTLRKHGVYIRFIFLRKLQFKYFAI